MVLDGRGVLVVCIARVKFRSAIFGAQPDVEGQWRRWLDLNPRSGAVEGLDHAERAEV